MKKIKIILTILTMSLVALVFTGCTSNQSSNHIVTFDFDFGYNISSEIVKSGETITMPNIPKREGYAFSHFELNGKPFDIDTKINSDIYLKAIWGRAISVNVDGDFKTFYSTKSSYKLSDFNYKLPDAELVGFYTVNDSIIEYIDLAKGLDGITLMYADFATPDLEFIEDEGYYTVEKYTGDKQFITIPNFYNKLPVKKISEGAFSQLKIPTKGIFIGNNVETICKFAFANSTIEDIVFPEYSKLTTLESSLINITKGLKELILPEGVKTIQDGAFAGALDLEILYLPNTIESIGDRVCDVLVNIKHIYLQKKPNSEYANFGWSFSSITKYPKVQYIQGVQDIIR